ncbi:unnamed protein product [Schistosoma mattheei]|uniref:Uncharacterized protein n=1 Tax=Schistosoma mattheei TaxID=31246 RepID=A0A183Q656_9TREM|nr:unnamed protein product [Schistosoma mattheei]
MRDGRQAVVPWALRPRSQVSNTTTDSVSFSCLSRRNILLCREQLGSFNPPRICNNTQDHLVDDQIPPSPLNNSITTSNPSRISLSPSGTNANDSSSRNVICGLIKLHFNLNVGVLNI